MVSGVLFPRHFCGRQSGVSVPIPRRLFPDAACRSQGARWGRVLHSDLNRPIDRQCHRTGSRNGARPGLRFGRHVRSERSFHRAYEERPNEACDLLRDGKEPDDDPSCENEPTRVRCLVSFDDNRLFAAVADQSTNVAYEGQTSASSPRTAMIKAAIIVLLWPGSSPCKAPSRIADGTNSQAFRAALLEQLGKLRHAGPQRYFVICLNSSTTGAESRQRFRGSGRTDVPRAQPR